MSPFYLDSLDSPYTHRQEQLLLQSPGTEIVLASFQSSGIPRSQSLSEHLDSPESSITSLLQSAIEAERFNPSIYESWFEYLSRILEEISPILEYLPSSPNCVLPIMKATALFTLSLLGSGLSGLLPREDPPRNDGIHLAVGPSCGPLGGSYADVNAGLVPQSFKTIVSFGDSYTDGGIDNGSTLLPPVLIPPNNEAGGRSTNGPVWIEGVASDIGATLMDYAQWGACTDLSLWPSNPRKVDFLGQMQTFLGQNHTLDPDTTLYSIFFGINDYLASLIDGNHMPAAAQVILDQISILSSPPTNGKSFLVLDVYGRGTVAPQGEAFKQQIYDGLNAFHQNSTNPLNVAYVDLAPIWDGVLNGNPGYQAFGYSSPDSCTECQTDCNEFGWCKDGEHYFYWLGGHPSKETHRIMADFVDEVLSQCKV